MITEAAATAVNILLVILFFRRVDRCNYTSMYRAIAMGIELLSQWMFLWNR